MAIEQSDVQERRLECVVKRAMTVKLTVMMTMTLLTTLCRVQFDFERKLIGEEKL